MLRTALSAGARPYPAILLVGAILLASPPAGLGATVSYKVTNGMDDAYCRFDSSGSGSSSSVDNHLYFGFNLPFRETTALRFRNVNLPYGAIITSACIKVYCSEVPYIPPGKSADGSVQGWGTVNVKIDAESSAAPDCFTNGAAGITNRVRTVSSVAWAIPSTEWTLNAEYVSPDISTVLQELCYDYGWPAGRPVVIFLNGLDTSLTDRKVYSYEGSINTNATNPYGAQLVIGYVTNGGMESAGCVPGSTNHPPVVPAYWNFPAMYYPSQSSGICWTVAAADVLGYWDITNYCGVTYWNLVDNGPAPVYEFDLPSAPGHAQGNSYAMITNLTHHFYVLRHAEDDVLFDYCNTQNGLGFAIATNRTAVNNWKKIGFFDKAVDEVNHGRPLVATCWGTYFGEPHAVPVIGYKLMSNRVESTFHTRRGDSVGGSEYVNPFDPDWGGLDLTTIVPGGTPRDEYEALGDSNRNTCVTLHPEDTYDFRQTHNFATTGDVDWIRFDAVAFRNYTIRTRNLGTNCDTIVCLYDSDGTTYIDGDDDHGDESRASKIEWRCTSGGTKFISVRDKVPTAYGPSANYDIEVDFSTADIFFVSTSGSNIFPYSSWATAAADIQSAIDAAGDGDLVVVSNGTYSIASQLVVTNAITLRSVNGARFTVVDAGGRDRCLYLSRTNAVVEGFTFTGGLAEHCGGGVYIEKGGALRNCRVVGNTANDFHMDDDFVAAYAFGGGVYCVTGLIENCAIVSNRATAYAFATNYFGTRTANATAEGGGIRGLDASLVVNCLVLTNGVVASTSGPFGPPMFPSIMARGGGIETRGCVTNTTVCRNYINVNGQPIQDAGAGGGIYSDGGYVGNTISWENHDWATTTHHDIDGSNFTYCCFERAMPGAGNIVMSDPKFMNPAVSDFHLKTNSPCVDTGTSVGAPACDIAGVPRPLDGDALNGAGYDMGAYECGSYLLDSDGDRLSDGWESYNGLNPNSSTGVNGADGDLDGDGLSNEGEYNADTLANDPSSCLQFVRISLTGTNLTLNWFGGQASRQYIESRRSLTSTSEVWVAIFTNLPPTAMSNSLSRPLPAVSTNFYRIRAVR